MNSLVPPESAAVDLENISLSRKEDWKLWVYAPPLTPPPRLTCRQIAALGPEAIFRYNEARRVWHANLGPIETPQLKLLHRRLKVIVGSNRQFGDKPKDAIAVDAYPGLGKTTAVLAFAKEFHQQQIALRGPMTPDGNERWPVCRVGLTGNTGMLDFNKAMLEFYGHPGTSKGSAAHFARRALDCVLSCQTRLLVVDDLHFLRFRETNGVEISNHFKYIANEFPVTLLFVGVGLARRGLFSEGGTDEDSVMAQLGRRTKRLGLAPFTIDTDERRFEWRQLLLNIEQQLILANVYPGMIADDLSDYLFARSTGHIGSLMSVVRGGCELAALTGAERFTAQLLDEVDMDDSADRARAELDAAISSGRLTTKLGTRRGKRGGTSRPTASRRSKS
ncbi:ATP-binding protein [Nocardia yunnanensis]|uniref:ATP-binding protein n=1 Tax=Nocardia yunnanensis TaxID=2382165 RepID=A0A386ZFS2_9NOCA|nr:AAA family ATPase [Nocardia yunnanensis]AYF76073.1 ATP-binding protein [Nocardia yunnanensis]